MLPRCLALIAHSARIALDLLSRKTGDCKLRKDDNPLADCYDCAAYSIV